MKLITETFSRNTLTIVDELPGDNSVYGSMGFDDADSLERFGRGRMYYSRQFGDLYKYNFVLNQLQKRRTAKVLYAGCGVDYIRRIMAENYCICDEYVGIDLHLPNLRKAFHFVNPIAADYVCYDLTNGLKYPDGYFDAVLALDVVEHMPKREQGIALVNELARVCSDLLIITTPQIQNGKILFSDVHKYEFTKDEHNQFLKKYSKKFKYTQKFGLHMSTKDYLSAIKTNKTLQKIHEFTGSKLLRGLIAAANPEIANDLVLCFSNKEPII